MNNKNTQKAIALLSKVVRIMDKQTKLQEELNKTLEEYSKLTQKELDLKEFITKATPKMDKLETYKQQWKSWESNPLIPETITVAGGQAKDGSKE